MKFTSIISSTALVVALSFSGSAFAQTMIGSQTVSADDLAKVQDHCDTVNEAKSDNATNSVGLNESNNSTAEAEGAAVPVDNNAQALTTVNLEAITAEDCAKAGLVTQVPGTK